MCPFHKEKTPSFIVNPAKQVYHCFGCGVGGTLFNYVMTTERLTFPESVQRLAELAGIPLEEIDSSPEEKERYAVKKEIHRLCEFAARFYHDQLQMDPSAQTARLYLNSRKCAPQIIKQFLIGFAPSAGRALYYHCIKSGFTLESLQKAGLIIPGRMENDWIDAFRGRIMFPIANAMGEIVAFGGRTLEEHIKPKYINTAETILFNKGANLYGLYQARQAIQNEQSVIIVEGYFDVIACHQDGISNTVASLGTALTDGQIRILKRYTRNIYLSFDGDDAGIAATKRSGTLLWEQGILSKVVMWEGAKDPDEFIMKFNALHFKKLIVSAVSLVEYLIHSATKEIPNPTFDDKIMILDALFPYIQKIENIIEQKHYIHIISQKLSIDEGHVAEELLRRIRKVAQERLGAPTDSMPLRTDEISVFTPDEEVIIFLFKHPEMTERIFKAIDPDKFNEPICRKTAYLLKETLDRERKINVQTIINELSGEDAFIRRISKALIDDGKYADVEKAADDFIVALRRNDVKAEKRRILNSIREAEQSGKQDEMLRLLSSYQDITRSHN